MEHACMLLKTSDLTINSIDEQSGYEDNVYFRKVFRKVIGKTPIEYRNS
ncbi:helix-turn-helix domain-containing protein [Cohnella sp. CFH 77786]|nr:helix-turn-helix domain-containing protein [Cohnella sp. CFH 77786]MBW5445189.1 helix-turn-helix domain-containing protein [Cohnella sp. CFH 77786]